MLMYRSKGNRRVEMTLTHKDASTTIKAPHNIQDLHDDKLPSKLEGEVAMLLLL